MNAITSIMPGAGVTPTEFEKSTKRGIRNNNPLNMERTGIQWNGRKAVSEMTAVQRAEPRFLVFRSPEYGIRAAAINFQTYRIRDGRDTIRKIISAWAPKVENETEAYIQAVAKEMEVGSDEVIDTSDAHVLLALIKAMIRRENGVQPYDDDLVMRGISMALSGVAAPVPDRSETKTKIDSLGRSAGKVAMGAGLVVLIGLINQEQADTLTASIEVLLTPENKEAVIAILGVAAGAYATVRSWFAPERKI